MTETNFIKLIKSDECTEKLNSLKVNNDKYKFAVVTHRYKYIYGTEKDWFSIAGFTDKASAVDFAANAAKKSEFSAVVALNDFDILVCFKKQI